MSREQISEITEPIIGWGLPDEIMSLAKSSSRQLYAEFEPTERVEKINNLVRATTINVQSHFSDHFYQF